MIVGHGIDLQAIDRMIAIYERNTSFTDKVLTEKEKALFTSFNGVKRQMEFLAGRWAAKEAFSKAIGSGIGTLTFQDIEILPNEKGAPIVTKSPFKGKVFVSISHSGNFAQASVILEE